MSMPLRRVLAGVWLLIWAVVAGPLHAHAVLLSADPADGSVLAEAPDAARIRFNEAVEPLVIRLVAPDGSETELTQSVHGAEELTVPLSGLSRGTYVLSWRVVSADGHPIPGTLVFSVGEITGTSGQPPEGDPMLRVGLWLARLAMTAGLVLGVGGALFGACFGLSNRAVRPVRRALVLGAIAGPTYLGLHGLDALGLGPSALFTPQPWAAAWGTSFGPSIAVAVAAAVLALASLRWGWLAWGAVALLAVSYAISGHAGAAQPRILTRSMVVMHLLALVFWIGALVPLSLSLRESTLPLRRFSAFIPVAVLALLLSGGVLAFVQLGPETALWLSPYGLIMGAKLALLFALFALAAFNRWTLTAPAMAGDAAAHRAIRRSIWAEIALAVVIFGLTAGWRFTPPPRALAEQVATPAFAHLHSEDVMANVTLSPGTSGSVSVQIELADGEIAPLEVMGVTFGASLPGRGIGRIARPAQPVDVAAGIWRVDGFVLPLSGKWDLDLEIRLTRFSQTKLLGTIDIR